MVATGAGITLLPRSTAAVELRGSEELVALPIQGSARRPGPSRTLGLAWRTSSPRGEEFALLGEALRG
jgi:LysR family hydrogen peroxide-inducible transcriptional activator